MYAGKKKFDPGQVYDINIAEELLAEES